MICGIVTLTHMDGVLLGVVLDMVVGIIPGILLGVLVDGTRLTIIVVGTILGITVDMEDIMVADMVVTTVADMVVTTVVVMVMVTAMDITQDLAEAVLEEAPLVIEMQTVADQVLIAQVVDQ